MWDELGTFGMPPDNRTRWQRFVDRLFWRLRMRPPYGGDPVPPWVSKIAECKVMPESKSVTIQWSRPVDPEPNPTPMAGGVVPTSALPQDPEFVIYKDTDEPGVFEWVTGSQAGKRFRFVDPFE